MIINYSELKNAPKRYLDLVADNNETLTVKRRGKENSAIISEDRYLNIMENLHIMGNKANYDWLMESVKQSGV